MSAMLVWHSKHQFLAIILVALGVGLAVINLPEEWLTRMETISVYQQDLSFQSRQGAWEQGLSYLQSDPWTGSGFEGWRAINAKFQGFGDPGTLDWHSAYVEVVVEHGISGFVLWSTLLIGTIISLSFMIRRGIRSGESWAVDHGAMLRASIVAYGIGG
jgi:O-antigen ligase